MIHCRLFKCNIPVTEGIIVSYTYDCTMATNIAHCMRLRTSENDKFVLLRPSQYESTGNNYVDILEPLSYKGHL